MAFSERVVGLIPTFIRDIVLDLGDEFVNENGDLGPQGWSPPPDAPQDARFVQETDFDRLVRLSRKSDF